MFPLNVLEKEGERGRGGEGERERERERYFRDELTLRRLRIKYIY